MKTCFKSIKLLLKTYPSFIIQEVISWILSVFMSLIPIYVIADVIDMYTSKEDIKKAITYVIVVFALLSFIEIIFYILNFYRAHLQRMFIAKTSELFYKKVQRVDYDFHESPVFLNGYTRSLEMGVENIFNVCNNSFAIVKTLLQSISVLSVIASIDTRIIIVVVIISLIYIFTCLRMGFLFKKEHSLRRPFQRASWYNRRAFVIKDSMSDIKTTNIDKMLIENNENSFKNILKVIRKYRSRSTAWAAFCDTLLICLYPIMVALIAYFTTNIEENIAAFASMTVAASTLSGIIMSFTRAVGELEGVVPDAKVPFDLLELEGKIENGRGEEFNEDFESLEIKDLDFSYDSKKMQLDSINLNIKRGEKIAIVGANGAGKTTLVKMLLRLYDPCNGYIAINEKKYSELETGSLRKVVGAVFQNIETYALTIGENILLRQPKTEEDIDLIDEALKFSGLYDFVYSLKDNINTEVTREFNREGIAFSGGQNQRLALARGYAQKYQLFILDEPSSALDPFAEAEIYKNMLEIGKDKAIIFISHRLTTTVNADRIYLFDNGKVIECGTHEELMKNKMKYYEMFESQSKKYIGEDYE